MASAICVLLGYSSLYCELAGRGIGVPPPWNPLRQPVGGCPVDAVAVSVRRSDSVVAGLAARAESVLHVMENVIRWRSRRAGSPQENAVPAVDALPYRDSGGVVAGRSIRENSIPVGCAESFYGRGILCVLGICGDVDSLGKYSGDVVIRRSPNPGECRSGGKCHVGNLRRRIFAH